MKRIGMSDGCANGGMMDSLSMTNMEEDSGNWEPPYVVEVTDEEWDAWVLFLKEHDKWEGFWDKKLTKAERTGV